MCKKLSLLSFAVLTLSLFAALGVAWAVPVEQYLTNPSFEGGVQASGCPTGWVCGGSPSPGFGAYAPTTAQYNPLVVPDGTHAAYSPTALAGSGTLVQNTATNWVNGTLYTFTFWAGHPLDLSWPASRVEVDLLVNGVQDNLSGNGTGTVAFTVPDPGVGNWAQYSFSYTPTSVTGTIGVMFQEVTSVNHQGVNFDIASTTGTALPEPATMLLFGLGLIGLAGIRRKM